MKCLITIIGALLLATAAPAAEKSAPKIVLEHFELSGDLSGGRAVFTLAATARVEGSHGGSLTLLRGPVALSELKTNPKWRFVAAQDQLAVQFDRAGSFPFEVRFETAVRQANGWNEIDFSVAPATLQPVRVRGLSAETQFDFASAARPEYHNSEFDSFLASDGRLKLRWKEASLQAEGKLFYSGEMLSQINVSPGLLHQAALLDFKVTQGELNRLTLLLEGTGEVTRVQGEQVLAWNIEPSGKLMTRRLVVRFNQAQKDHFAIQIQTQSPLGAFPQTADVLRIRPEAATRFAGYFRIANEGAVRLEVTQAGGLSQVSPDQFPESDLTRAALRSSGTQAFVYRFSTPDFALRIQADQVLPELTISELLSYHLGANDLSIDGEFELDIREAPLRELSLRIPAGYMIAQLNAAGLSDYFQPDAGKEADAELRLVFGQPISGREVVRLRLERNKPLDTNLWTLPRIDIPKAKSLHGHIATIVDAGFRLSPERTAGLTEIAPAFFPRKVAGIQSAFRISEPAWQSVLRVERLAQTVQADVLHLFSVGEGIAYGSSVINYVVSGAPVSIFKIELSDEYFNVEFTGKDVRNWQKTAGGYQVQLHSPVSGAYTLLATYERPFKPQGETLTFTGGRPLEVQSEQGHTLVISAYQFQVKPVDVSPGLLPLEPGEVPAEYRLLFDAPVLAAYRYVARPFSLRLALSPLAQGDSLSMVVDRASLTTRISKEGQVLTDARYFVKNRGNTHLRLTLPSGTRLWSVAVNAASVVPVADGSSNLVPLPQGVDPNAVLTLDFKLASVSSDARHVLIAAPIVNAPVMLAQWRVGPDVGQRLIYRRGSLTPAGGELDDSGFAQFAELFNRGQFARSLSMILPALALLVLGIIAWRWAGSATARGNPRHVSGIVIGIICGVLAFCLLERFAEDLPHKSLEAMSGLTFVAPVQQAGSALNVDVLNLEDKPSAVRTLAVAWPILLAVPAWIVAWKLQSRAAKSLAIAFSWLIVAWTILRLPNGGAWCLAACAAGLLIYVLLPSLVRSWRSPPQKTDSASIGSSPGTAPATLIALLAGFLALSQHHTLAASRASSPIGYADSVRQEISVEAQSVFAVAKIRWEAEKGQLLPLLFEPAVLTGIEFPPDSIRLERRSGLDNREPLPPGVNPGWIQQLVAKKSGVFDLVLRYELKAVTRENQTGFSLPVASGLVNRLNLTLANRDVDVTSPQAISVNSEVSSNGTLARLVLSAATNVWITWKPRARDLIHEKPVFFAELSQLFVPAAGVIEAEQYVSLRLAQGQLSEVILDVPKGLTITDVLDPIGPEPLNTAAKPLTSSIIALWRFDPDARKLRINLSAPQQRPFALLIKSQVATGPLPFENSLGILRVLNAAGQLGLVGVATGSEVQLDSVTPDLLSPINLEDFPSNLVARIELKAPGLTLRRAFRYAQPGATLSLKASAVEPDVHVESQDTISIGEDRTVLAVNASVGITRAGIFRLSFDLPQAFDVESVSGPGLSHWTESPSETNRVITLHLNGKTEGQQQFAITLVGRGLKATNGWAAPQLVFRETSKQSGTILLVPEQGLRLQVAASDGLAQLDPQKSGIKQKGVLAFRVLQNPRTLTLNIEQVNAWVQVNSLQHATVGEAQIKIAANLQYQIENAGLKSFRILVPTNAESVHFQGEQLADFLPLPATVTNGLQAWEVRLQRRVIGSFLLQLTYQVPLPEGASQLVLRGIQATDVNLQRGYVTVESAGRLQLRIGSLPTALQTAEWQSIPRILQQGLQGRASNFSYRLVEPAFDLPLAVERYQAAQLLPGRITSISFNSVVSDDGVMLTQARLEMIPGSKRLLRMALPKNASFWFAFVSQNGVWPWRDQDQILIPLEQQAVGDRPIEVELFYTCKIGQAGRRSLELELLAPTFDLPLENITWRVSLGEKWELKRWAGSLQLQQDEIVAPTPGLDVRNYLQSENLELQQRTKKAEGFLAAANSALAQGDPQQARRAFQSAYGLSMHDAAFNEDARVQLHNIKLQEAMVALNVRQAVAGGDSAVLGDKLRELRDRKVANYTQQDAKDIIDRNSSDENAAFMKLAERLIQQQDAAATVPAALHASIPEQGRVLTFKRAVLVDPWATLRIDLKTGATNAASWLVRGSILAVTFLLLALLTWIANNGSEASLS